MSAPRNWQYRHTKSRTNDRHDDTGNIIVDTVAKAVGSSSDTKSIPGQPINTEKVRPEVGRADSSTNSPPANGTTTVDDASSEDPRAEPASDSQPDGDMEAGAVTQPKYSVFTPWEKRGIVLAAAVTALFSPLSAQIYFPVLNTLAREFSVSATQINLTVTTYMVFQGVVPMFVGSFADACGRRPAYLVCFVVYLGANIGLALAPSYGSLLALRCLQSAGSSSTVALCSAVVADIVTSAERGQYIGITAVPAILAPSLGPVIGGLLASRLGWRSIFWFLTIFGAVTLLALLLFFPETCRRLVGDGSTVPHPAYRTLWRLAGDALRRRSRRQARVKAKARLEELQRRSASTSRDGRNDDGLGPALAQTATSCSERAPSLHVGRPHPLGSLRMLGEPMMFLLLFYSSIVFAGFYATATALPIQFASAYRFGPLRIGLSYLPMAGGSVVAAFLVGPLMNRNYRRHCRRLGVPYDRARQQDLSDFPIERARLELGVPLLALSAAGTAGWGWALQAEANIAVPYVLLFVQGVALIGFHNTVSALLVDVNPGRAGTATAAGNLTRCLVGAGASAAIVPLIDRVGSGWAFTLVAALYLVFSPLLWLVVRNGVRWRRRAREREQRKVARRNGVGDGEARQRVSAESAADGEGRNRLGNEQAAESKSEEGKGG